MAILFHFHVSAFREIFNDYDITEAFFNYKYDGSKADLCSKNISLIIYY